jgi:hypothetical protein
MTGRERMGLGAKCRKRRSILFEYRIKNLKGKLKSRKAKR